MLQKRQQTIKDGLKQAQEARELLEETAQKERAVLQKAQEEARKLLEETRKKSDSILRHTEEATREQAKQILDEARKQINFETKQAEKQLAMQMTGLTIEFLQKSITQLFSKEDQELILKNAVQKMKKRVD